MFKESPMPLVNIGLNPKNHAFNDAERNIIKLITKKDGTLRATKPKNGVAAYTWRMVAFFVSPRHVHQCMPVMAPAYLPYKGVTREDQKRLQKGLDELVEKIVDCVPLHQQHGVMRWGHALGAF